MPGKQTYRTLFERLIYALDMIEALNLARRSGVATVGLDRLGVSHALIEADRTNELAHDTIRSQLIDMIRNVL